jgi:hypothetical protein
VSFHRALPVAWSATNTVAAPANMNVSVATIDRFDNRLTPQMRCPLVQPPPSCEPKPTSKPAMEATTGALEVASIEPGRSHFIALPAVTIPRMKIILGRTEAESAWPHAGGY